jgi:hypothetical protein
MLALYTLFHRYQLQIFTRCMVRIFNSAAAREFIPLFHPLAVLACSQPASSGCRIGKYSDHTFMGGTGIPDLQAQCCWTHPNGNTVVIQVISTSKFIFQSQYLINPSQLAVATFDVSWGCHNVDMHTSSWALNVLYNFVVFQSQMYSFPSASPDMI